MAQIPREHRKELPPVVPTRGIAGQIIGEAVEKSGRDIAMMGDALLEAHRVSVFNRKMSQAAIDLTKMQERAVDDTDYPTMGERYSEEMATYREEMLTGITDPTLHELVSRRFDELSAQKMVNIRSYARKGIVAEGEASVLASVDAYLDAMINSGTEQERAKYWAMAQGAITGGVTAGYYYADKAEAMLQKADRTRQVKEVEHDVIKYGPEKVMNSLYGKGPFTYVLDDDIRLDLRASVTAEYNRQVALAKAPDVSDSKTVYEALLGIFAADGPTIDQAWLDKKFREGKLSAKGANSYEHLSTQLSQRLSEDPVNSERDFAVKNGLKSIDQHYLYETDVEELTPEKWASIKNAFWQRTRSATTVKEVEDIYEEIIGPYRKEKAKSLLVKAWEFAGWGAKSIGEQLGIRKGKEEKLSPELAEQIMKNPVGTEVELTDGRVYLVEEDGPKRVK